MSPAWRVYPDGLITSNPALVRYVPYWYALPGYEVLKEVRPPAMSAWRTYWAHCPMPGDGLALASAYEAAFGMSKAPVAAPGVTTVTPEALGVPVWFWL